MSIPIQINEKLMEREDRLVDVHDIERQINILLGAEAYPFPAPPALPSRQKRSKVKRKVKKKVTKAIRIRKLDPDTESAYRVTYTDQGVERSEIHFTPQPITLLIDTRLPDLQVLRVETVQLFNSTDAVRVELLYDSATR